MMAAKLSDRVINFWNQYVLGDDSDQDVLPSAIRSDNARLNTYGLHNLLIYHEYDPETGLFYNDNNTVGFCLEVIPQTGGDEAMVARLTSLFNNLPAGIGLQWVLFSHPLMDEIYEHYVDLRRNSVEQGMTTDFFVDLAKRRVRAAKSKMGQPQFQNTNFTVKRARLVLSITKEGNNGVVSGNGI